MEFSLVTIAIISVVLAAILFGAVFILRFFQKVDQGKALIINTMRAEPIVTFTGGIVYPVINKSEVMEISLKTIEIDRRGQEGLICQDNIRADIKVTFFVRVNKTAEDVLKVAQSIGCERASDQSTLEELFSAKFSEALKTVGKQLDFEDLYKERDSFRDNIIRLIGKDLNGYVLEDAAIDFLEQTPLSSLDADNILDSQGIRKITELTTEQRVRTNHFENSERLRITKQDVEAQETVLELQRRQADAEAKQAREIQNVKDRETAEIATVAAEQKQRTAEARLLAEEKVGVADQNKQREIEVAEQNRQRVVGIETERVSLAREQEVIKREREVALLRIDKEEAEEEKKRDIANVIRERIAVEKTVAQEEEAIKTLRATSEAERNKQVMILDAEAEAEESLVKDIKSAEAAEKAASFRARENVVMAESDREVADKQAIAKIRLSEGVQAEAAADGLAQVAVKEANALAIEKEGEALAKAKLENYQAEAAGEERKGLARVKIKEANAEAIEKEGLAQAKVDLEKMQAQATGQEQQGLALARVKEADAVAIEKEGLAQAKVDLEKMQAVATGTEQQGLAEVRVKEADADATEKQGHATAEALRERLLAEAEGLAEKFKSLDALSEQGKDHEEFRLRLEQELAIQKEAIGAQIVSAEKQAEVLSSALSHANIDIVGGDDLFVDKLLKSTAMAKTIDGFTTKSDTTQKLFKDYFSGDASFSEDVKAVLSDPSLSSSDVQNLTVSAFIQKMMKKGTTEQKQQLEKLLGLFSGDKKS